MNIVLLLVTLVLIFLFSRNVLNMLFSVGDYKLHKKRLKQLQFENKASNADELNELINKVTKPVISHILPSLNMRNKVGIEKDLRMAKWDKYVSVEEFMAIRIIAAVVGVVALSVFWGPAKPIAVAWFVIFAIGPTFLLNNSCNNRRERFMVEFPDFIRVTQGYLTANMPFVKSIEESIRFTGKEWQPVLHQFVIDANLSGVDYALGRMRETVDLFEVKEFVALIRLTLEQGGGAKEGFEAQAEKIQNMLHDIMMIKIGKRKIMSVFIQGPLLLAIMATFGLPVIYDFMNLGM